MSNIIPMAELLPSKAVWTHWKAQGQELIKSGFLPDAIKTPEQFLAIVLKGRECGVPPMQACSHINIIKGKPTMSAELMLSQILKNCPTAKIWFPVRSDECVEVRCIRAGRENSFRYSIQDAKRAGLLNKSSWQMYPRAMLHARVVSEMARSVFPDCINGISYTPEELGAEVNDDGEVVTVEATTETKTQKLAATPSTSPVDTPKVEAKPDVAAYTPPLFSAKNAEHLKSIQKFLEQKNTLQVMADLCRRLDGKPFTKENVLNEFAIINPEAPDREPESEA
jgi:hypothetical protein